MAGQTASAYIFGAICPKDGKGAALVMPRCNTEAMNLHLAEIATQIAPGAHAVLLVDQAGWHLSDRLIAPSNITLIPFPAKCPELNPQENIWQFLRDNWLSNRIFKSFDDIVDHCCDAWNKLINSPADHVDRPSGLGLSVMISEASGISLCFLEFCREPSWPRSSRPSTPRRRDVSGSQKDRVSYQPFILMERCSRGWPGRARP